MLRLYCVYWTVWDRYLQVLYLGRAPRTKETLPDFLKWRRVTRPPLVFRGLTGSQRTPGFWGVTNLLNEGTNVGEFNTQSVDQISQSSPISPQIESTTKKFRGGNFSIEDLVLISGWLNISMDAVHGNEQKSKRYWQRV